MPVEEPEQRPDAAPRKAPAKKAPAKKAPAKKAPAKKAPAKKAPAKKAVRKAAPRATIMNRIQELEQRYATDPPPPAPESPVPVPVPVPEPSAELSRPADVAVVAPQELPAPDPDATQALPIRPAKRTPVAVVPEVAPPVAALPVKRAVPPVPVLVEPAVEDDLRHRPPGASALVKSLVGLIVLLLAVAGGLTTAWYVKEQPATWRAQSTVILTSPGSGAGSETTREAAAQYAVRARSESFAAATAELAGVPDGQVREYFQAQLGKDGEIRIQARAANADAAARMAEAGSRQLVLTVLRDQTELGDDSENLAAQVGVPVTQPVKEKPTDRSALLAGLLAGVNVLLVAAMIGLLGKRPARSRGR